MFVIFAHLWTASAHSGITGMLQEAEVGPRSGVISQDSSHDSHEEDSFTDAQGRVYDDIPEETMLDPPTRTTTSGPSSGSAQALEAFEVAPDGKLQLHAPTATAQVPSLESPAPAKPSGDLHQQLRLETEQSLTEHHQGVPIVNMAFTFGSDTKQGYTNDKGLPYGLQDDGFTYGWRCVFGTKTSSSNQDGLTIGPGTDATAGVKNAYNDLSGIAHCEDAPEDLNKYHETVVWSAEVTDALYTVEMHWPFDGKTNYDRIELVSPRDMKQISCTSDSECTATTIGSPVDFFCREFEAGEDGETMSACASCRDDDDCPGAFEGHCTVIERATVMHAVCTGPNHGKSSGYRGCYAGPTGYTGGANLRNIDLTAGVDQYNERMSKYPTYTPDADGGYTWAPSFVLSGGYFDFWAMGTSNFCPGIGSIKFTMIPDSEISPCTNTDTSGFSTIYPCKCGVDTCTRLQMCDVAGDKHSDYPHWTHSKNCHLAVCTGFGAVEPGSDCDSCRAAEG